MVIHIHVDSMRAAEKLSYICKNYSGEMFLKSESFCIDPKSTLGILALMYSARDTMYLDTGSLNGEEIEKLKSEIADFLFTETESVQA